MDNLPLEKRAIFAVKRLAAILLSRVRRIVGSLLQLVVHDQLGDISRETKRLGSASVESVNYVGSELQALDQRLSRIEEELAALRRERERTDDVTSAPRS